MKTSFTSDVDNTDNYCLTTLLILLASGIYVSTLDHFCLFVFLHQFTKSEVQPLTNGVQDTILKANFLLLHLSFAGPVTLV